MISMILFIIAGIGVALIFFFLFSRLIGILEPDGFKALAGYTVLIVIPIALIAFMIRTWGF